MKSHNAANNSRRRTDLELVEELLAVAHLHIRVPLGNARLADALRIWSSVFFSDGLSQECRSRGERSQTAFAHTDAESHEWRSRHRFGACLAQQRYSSSGWRSCFAQFLIRLLLIRFRDSYNSISMAAGFHFACDSCSKTLEAWDDGNPYYLDDGGGKHYAYHPDDENLARCVGNDSPNVCLKCGKEFMVDSESSRESCPACGANDFVETIHVNGKPCPFCKRGVFRDSGVQDIS